MIKILLKYLLLEYAAHIMFSRLVCSFSTHAPKFLVNTTVKYIKYHHYNSNKDDYSLHFYWSEIIEVNGGEIVIRPLATFRTTGDYRQNIATAVWTIECKNIKEFYN